MTHALNARLEWLENTADMLVHGRDPELAALAAQLAYEDQDDVDVQLGDWHLAYPRAFSILLGEVARVEDVARKLAPILALSLGFWERQRGLEHTLDDVFVAGFGALQDPGRAWVAERRGVADALGLREGRDFVRTRLRPEEVEALVPRGSPPPDLATIAGVQTHLIRQGYNAGPVTGAWNEQTARALLRLQYDQHHPAPSGELDDLTRSMMKPSGS